MALWVRQFNDICCRYTLEECPQNTCVMHTHDELEIYYFMTGDCTYMIEGTAYHLRPHDLVFKRPLEAHKLVVNSQTTPYERIGITISPDLFNRINSEHHLFDTMMHRPLGTDNRFTASDFGNDLYVHIMEQIAVRGQSMTHTEFLSHLFLILTEADRVLKHKNSIPQSNHRATVGTRVIDFTNEHLYTDISIQALCDTFFLSYSQINRLFKQYTGSTAGQYISTKRLLTARDKIRHGVSPAEACYECGYHDYSSFYRAYIKRFGHSPQYDKR